MGKGWTWMSGAGLGAGLMYLLDPDRGKRRRALLRDQMVHTWHRTSDAMGITARDLNNRIHGIAAKTRSRFTCEEVDDEVLAERVRARLGHVVTHPRSIDVVVRGGRVTVSGPILAGEAGRMLSSIASVRGVVAVEDRLERHERAENVPGLQSGAPESEQRERTQRTWSPTVRLLVGATGAALALVGARRQGAVGALLGTVGLGMLAQGLSHGSHAGRSPGAARSRASSVEG
jgi:hypothetical protein